MTEAVGSLGEEASRLLGAAEEWMRGARERVGGAVGDLGAHPGPECQVCPVCQLLAVLRTASPEMFEHLVAASASLVAAARAALDAHDRNGARRRDAHVERIDIR